MGRCKIVFKNHFTNGGVLNKQNLETKAIQNKKKFWTRKNMNRNFKEKAMQLVFLLAACASIIAVILICVFMFGNGIPTIRKIGFWNFLSGTEWKPLQEIFGILPMIVGSIYVTAGAIMKVRWHWGQLTSGAYFSQCFPLRSRVLWRQ